MKKLRFVALLLATIAFSIQAWSYRITDNYTIEAKFKINAIAAGVAFRAYEGFDGQICAWQFNVGTDGSKSNFRPHDWKVGGILLQEIDTRNFGVTLNTTDWFVTKIVISNNGGHADTYLRRAEDATDVLIDSRDGNFRFGMVGTRQDHYEANADDPNKINESASYDYFKVTANGTDEVLYYEDFNTTNGDWTNSPTWDSTNGWLTTEGRDYSEVKYYPNNMFKDAVSMHYAVEADLTFESGFISLILGLTDSGSSNYMWQISPNYYVDGSVNTYYHLDNGNESWKAHAAGPRYPYFTEAGMRIKRHVKIEVKANVVYTYIDGKLVDTFTQCDLTDLELLNPGKMGLRADGNNGKTHKVYVDNVKLTQYDASGNPTVKMYETFNGGTSTYFDTATHASIESVDGNYALLIDTDGTSDKVRLIQKSELGSHTCSSYQNGICQTCGAYEEPDITDGVYTIGNLGQLIRFSQIVNTAGIENQQKNGSLTSDIDMEYSTEFTPIGLNNDVDILSPYRGTFYGNNHVVRNLRAVTECEGGLFSRLNGGTIRNLGVENGYIESTANLRCGAVVGELFRSHIYNCFARGTFNFVTTHEQRGGLCGEAAEGYLDNCYTTLSRTEAATRGTQTNCYEGVSSSDPATTSGELCYNLGSAFHQTLGTDTYPELDVTKPRVYQIAVSNVGYATFVPEENIAAIPTGVTAYAGQNMGSYLHLEEVTELPADNAVVVKATEGNYYCNGTDASRTLGTSNNLTFYSSDTEATGTQYCLANKDAGIGFYQVQSGVTIPARKAYLAVPAGVKAFYGFEDDEATSINSLTPALSEGEGVVYNLAGQRISKKQKGINIVNGKKIMK